MKKYTAILLVTISMIVSSGCSKTYKAKPMPFKMPSAYANVVKVDGAELAAKAFADIDEAKNAFGFDIRSAGMLPVQVVFDNRGMHSLEINAQQTFLEDTEGNLWPILSNKLAHERATKYAKTTNIAKESAYHGLWGAAAGTLIGAAVGIVTGEDVASAAGKGAAVGAAAGATLGGGHVYGSDEPVKEIISDLAEKSLQNNAIAPNTIAHGFLFFPGEVESVKQLRLYLIEKETGMGHVLNLKF